MKRRAGFGGGGVVVEAESEEAGGDDGEVAVLLLLVVEVEGDCLPLLPDGGAAEPLEAAAAHSRAKERRISCYF